MRIVICLIVVSLSLLSQGCSYKAWYGGMQQRQRQECYEKNSRADVQSCLDKANLTYEQYKAAREEAVGK